MLNLNITQIETKNNLFESYSCGDISFPIQQIDDKEIIILHLHTMAALGALFHFSSFGGSSSKT